MSYNIFIMNKKITILFLAIFLSGCSISNNVAVEDKNVNLSILSGGNNLRESINNYLLSQEHFAWKTVENGKNFCVFYPFNKINEPEIYLWVRCSEFVFENGALKEESGISGPVKLIYPLELSYFDYTEFSYVVPRDGSFYGDDLKEIFPKEIREEMNEQRELILVNLNSELIEQAADYFGVKDFSEIPSSFIQRCNQDSDCITPFNYLIRSSCPYSSRCVDDICEVVCNY